MIPQDPVMLLSFINTNLRDHYKDLDALSDGLELSAGDLEAIIAKLENIGYSYDKNLNKFI